MAELQIPISSECQKIIENINDTFSDVQDQLKTAQSRYSSAEIMLSEIRKNITTEMQKAYEMGYRACQKDIEVNSGGTQNEKNDEIKLVLENN